MGATEQGLMFVPLSDAQQLYHHMFKLQNSNALYSIGALVAQ